VISAMGFTVRLLITVHEAVELFENVLDLLGILDEPVEGGDPEARLPQFKIAVPRSAAPCRKSSHAVVDEGLRRLWSDCQNSRRLV
jgi:hypothetical protein